MYESQHHLNIDKQNQKRIRNRWRNSINQFSRIEEESRLSLLNTRVRKSNKILLATKNRLAQIDPQFIAQINQEPPKLGERKEKLIKNISTRHNTNILSSEGLLTNFNLQLTVVLDPQGSKKQKDATIIREELMEELTNLNSSSYRQEMKSQCTKYLGKNSFFWGDWLTAPKKPLYEFCYFCDSILGQQDQGKKHLCERPLTSIANVQSALEQIQKQVIAKNNKIFSIFLYNTRQAEVEVGELVNNVRVLKQAVELKYEPEEAVLRLRLLNLMGKKIGLLLQEQQIHQMLESLSLSK